MADHESVRRQIQAAVQQARERAYARAMHGGAMEMDMDEMEMEMNGGGIPKGTVYKQHNKLRSARALKGFYDGQGRKNKNKKNALGFAAYKNQPRHTGERRVNDYKTSPVEFNPKYRSYVVAVEGQLMYRLDREGKRKMRVFHGKPIAAARKVAGSLAKDYSGIQSKQGTQYDLYTLNGDANAYLQAKETIRSGKPLRIRLTEITRGVRKQIGVASGNPHLSKNPEKRYFRYNYWISRERLSNPTSHGVHNAKTGQDVVIRNTHKNVAVRSYDNKYSYAQAVSHKNDVGEKARRADNLHKRRV